MTNQELENIYQNEIELKNIDEITDSHVGYISRKNNCISFELVDYLITEKNFKAIRHYSGFKIFQRPDLEVNNLFDAIDSYFQYFRERKGITLYEIVQNYKELQLTDDAYFFSLKSIIEKLNHLKTAK